jgi:DNA-binding transcriptional MerR regulator
MNGQPSSRRRRFYEKEGLLPRPARTEGGYRRYHEREVADLEFIQKAQQLGFSLNEIRELFSIQRHLDEACIHVQDLIAAKLDGCRRRSHAQRCSGATRPDQGGVPAGVGIVAPALALTQDYRVDGTERAGIIGNVSEERQDRLLARVVMFEPDNLKVCPSISIVVGAPFPGGKRYS